jgi:dTDP-4-amino-4,6-dideoxygalactose transaminase
MAVYVGALLESRRDARMEALSGAAIEIRTYFAPACHAQAQFSECSRSDLRMTESLSRGIISLPLWEGMGRKDVDRVVQVLAG